MMSSIAWATQMLGQHRLSRTDLSRTAEQPNSRTAEQPNSQTAEERRVPSKVTPLSCARMPTRSCFQLQSFQLQISRGAPFSNHLEAATNSHARRSRPHPVAGRRVHLRHWYSLQESHKGPTRVPQGYRHSDARAKRTARALDDDGCRAVDFRRLDNLTV